MLKISLWASAGLALALHGVQAQETTLPLWEAGVLAGALSTPAYPASTDRASRALVLPYFVYRGDVLRADRSGVGARMAHTDAYEFDIGFAGSLPASSENVAARVGMSDLGTLVEFGPRLKVTLARPTAASQLRLELPLRQVLEINSGIRGQGVAFEPELAFSNRDWYPGWHLTASGSLIFGDSQLNQYFYGVAAPDATATRPAYAAQAGLIATRLSLGASTALGKDVRVLGFVRTEHYGAAANRDSPLFQQSTGTSAGLVMTWILGRSEAPARD